jgi:hypothetical protein
MTTITDSNSGSTTKESEAIKEAIKRGDLIQVRSGVLLAQDFFAKSYDEQMRLLGRRTR